MTMSHTRRRQTRSLAALAGLLALTTLGPVSGHTAPTGAAQNRKKGFDTVVRANGNWRRQVVALRAKWFYSWGGDEPKDMPRGVEFVPMDWGYYGDKGGSLTKWLADVKAQPNIHALLGFNEPDGKDQANLGVDGALEGWPHLMATGLPLGSPAAVHADGGWMKAFMQGAEQKKYRVDFVTIHWYGGNDPQGFLNYLAFVHDLYHRPLWITEFAPADWGAGPGRPNRYTPAQMADFMRAVLPEMNRRTYVQRYAWYSAGPKDAALGPAALFNDAGSLTDLGRLYASL